MLGREMVTDAFERWLQSMAGALFPAKCLGCGRLFHYESSLSSTENVPVDGQTSGFSRAMALHLCPHCRIQWTAVASPMCSRCGMVFNSRVGDNHLCGRCLDRPPVFSRARAVGVYDGSLRIVIHALKFRGAVRLGGPLGKLLLEALQHHWKTDHIDVVAPVPLHQRRLRQRGFNQAYLLMKGWRLPGKTLVSRDLLVRTRPTPPQTGLDRNQRRINIKNVFSMHRPGQSSSKRILLVDDVLTTGATADACAQTLIRDGAERVDVLTLARAP